MRLKRGTVENPKFKKLARRLELEQWAAVGVLEALWMFAGQYARAGDIGRWSDEDLAEAIGWTDGAGELVEALVAEGWFDCDPVHRLLIHDWPDHADNVVRRALQREDARRRGVPEREGNPGFAVPGTPLDTADATPTRHRRDTDATVSASTADPPILSDPIQSNSTPRTSGATAPASAPRPGGPHSKDPGAHREGAERLRRGFVATLLAADPAHGVARKTDFGAWDRDLERLLRLDNRSEIEVRRMIEWAGAHEFWAAVIQSPRKLRARWDQMAAQRRRDEPPPPRSPPSRPAFDYRVHAAEDPDDRRTLAVDGTLVEEVDEDPPKLARPEALAARGAGGAVN